MVIYLSGLQGIPTESDEGERLRLVTDANDGPYRFENIVLLRTLPQPTNRRLCITDIAAEIDDSAAGSPEGGLWARLNWRSSRPAICRVAYGQGTKKSASSLKSASSPITLSPSGTSLHPPPPGL
jgi:hypothetical protein